MHPGVEVRVLGRLEGVRGQVVREHGEEILQMIATVQAGTISNSIAKEVYAQMLATGDGPAAITTSPRLAAVAIPPERTSFASPRGGARPWDGPAYAAASHTPS